MKLAELLEVLREEFERNAADLDTRLVDWLGEPGEPGSPAMLAHAEALAQGWERLAEAMRLLNLEGLAQLQLQLADNARLLALSDDDTLGAGLSWLLGWHALVREALHQPQQPEPVAALLDFLRQGPLPPDEASLEALGELLRCPPQFSEDAHDPERFALAQPDDLSLALPDDLDIQLYETFLHEAPEQAAWLTRAVHRLARGPLPLAELQEVQRVAHTFKGSGNIIGLRAVALMAHRIEDVLDFALRQHGHLPRPIAHDLALACDSLEQMIAALRGEDQSPAEALTHLNTLIDWTRAIADDTWLALVPPEDVAPAETPATPDTASAANASPATANAPAGDAPAHPAAPDAPEAPKTPPIALPETPTPPALQAHVRVPMPRLDRLVRQAGQNLVRHSQLEGRVAQLTEQLHQLQSSHRALHNHLQALRVQIERQHVRLGLNLEEGARPADFDPLELDRYTELHSLGQLLAEQLADAFSLGGHMHEQFGQVQGRLREQASQLKTQHQDLLQTRLVPFRQIVARLRRTVSQTAASTGRQAELVLHGEDTLLDSDLLERLAEPLLHLLRNAVDHGLEPPEERLMLGKPAEGRIRLHLLRDGHSLRLTCEDDGRGLDVAAIRQRAIARGLLGEQAEVEERELLRLILLPGFSTRDTITQISGRGVGMDVVAQRITDMKGWLDIAHTPGLGTRFELSVPASVGSQHALVVRAGGQALGLLSRSVLQALPGQEVTPGQQPDEVQWRNLTWPLGRLHQWLGLPASPGPAATSAKPLVVVDDGQHPMALEVDEVHEARELIVQDVGRLLRHVPGLHSSAITRDGQVLLLYEPVQLAQHARRTPLAAMVARATARQPAPDTRPSVLVVDDALSVRQALARLLEDAGWRVLEARDGLDALTRLEEHTPSLLLTDLEMPRLNGLEMVRQLRADARWQLLPVLMLTSRASDKHRQNALALGVNRYLTKPCPDAQLLAALAALRDGAT